MGGVDGQVKAHPRLAVAFESFDIPCTQGCGFRPGVEFGRHFQIDAIERCVLIKAIHGLFPGHCEAGQAKEIKEGGEGLESHKS
ncbi:hypothetical protein D3C78_1585570 [compost metagenome]